MATVETGNISKRFGDVRAADGVDLSVDEGGVPAPSGDVPIGGRGVNHLPPRARKIAMVLRSCAPCPHRTVCENIAFPLTARTAPRPSRARR